MRGFGKLRRGGATLAFGVLATACESAAGPQLPPPPPAVLAAEASDREVELTWSLPSDEVTTIEVERAGEDGSFSTIATLNGAVMSFEDLGLAPETTYRYRLRACNQNGCSELGTEVVATTLATLVLEEAMLPPLVLGAPYQAAITASGGEAPLTFSLTGGRLPDNVTLAGDGTLAGMPSPTGIFEFTARVTSADGQTADATFRLIVREVLNVITVALPGATLGSVYNAALNALGGDSTYTWSIETGNLPEGIALSDTGILSGIPDREEIAGFTARVTSGDGQSASKQLSIAVTFPNTPTLTVSSAVLPPAVVGLPYGPALRAANGNGSPLSWSVVDGGLPPGVELDRMGGFSGVPTRSGEFTFTVLAQDGRNAFATFTVAVVPNDLRRFDITRFDVAPVPVEIDVHVRAAIERWESVIVGDLSADSIPRGFYGGAGCSGFGREANGASIDDVIVMVNIGSIDGEGSVLGRAGPCGYREDNYLTALGVLTLDEDDLERFVGTQTLTDIIFHEIGHVLGLGTLWDGFGCFPGSGRCLDYVEGASGSDPTFTGPGAVLEWHALGGAGNVPIENTGGSGTALSHWRESTFDTEIMTGFVERTGVGNPLSRLTIASFADLGYRVSYGAADPFVLPQTAPVAASGATVGEWELPLPEEPRPLPRRRSAR